MSFLLMTSQSKILDFPLTFLFDIVSLVVPVSVDCDISEQDIVRHGPDARSDRITCKFNLRYVPLMNSRGVSGTDLLHNLFFCSPKALLPAQEMSRGIICENLPSFLPALLIEQTKVPSLSIFDFLDFLRLRHHLTPFA